MILPVILAGGSGSRLWPLSRENYPKQFQKLYGNKTMLQLTIERLKGLDCLTPLIICNEEHRFLVAEQLREINCLNNNILLEPIGRNTAPAITAAAFHALKLYDNPSLLVLSADHLIRDEEIFQNCVAEAQNYVLKDILVTFGITPTYPEVGYGYIKKGENIGINQGYKIVSFEEKPSLSKAESYISSGDYLWNSGMFAFSAKTFLEEVKKYTPEIFNLCEISIDNSKKDLDFIRIDKTSFSKCLNISIDYAVMEATKNAVVIPLPIYWSDIGSWNALWDVSNKDENGNALTGDIIALDSKNNLINAESSMIVTLGIEQCIIVQTSDAILVASQAQAQNVKKVVQILKERNLPQAQVHRKVYRPWGNYDSIDTGARHQVKRITVKPGQKLSVQMHHHRAEHWIVVSGTAKIMINEEEKLITENQAVYISVGDVHSLENPGMLDLELIEVQVGSYLGEDDIVRFTDRYGRV